MIKTPILFEKTSISSWSHRKLAWFQTWRRTLTPLASSLKIRTMHHKCVHSLISIFHSATSVLGTISPAYHILKVEDPASHCIKCEDPVQVNVKLEPDISIKSDASDGVNPL